MIKKIMSFVEMLIVIIAFLFCIATILQRTVLQKEGIFGYKTYVIVTSSMSPEYERSDVILVKSTEKDNIKIGDNITYKGVTGNFKGKIVTHKVIDIVEKEGNKVFIAKGNKNLATDPDIYYSQILGVVKYKFQTISLLSKVIRTKIGFFFLVFIPLLTFFVLEIIKIKQEIAKDY
jgi:signal peptidase